MPLRQPHVCTALFVGVGALLSASCGGRTAEVVTGLPPSATVVDVHMEEYRFVYDKSIVPGRTIFKVTNSGKEDHSIVMFPVSDDFPPIDAQLHGDERRTVEPMAQVFPRKPGESGSFAVDLQPGQRYVFLCLIAASDGQSHALKGMNSEFVPSAPAPPSGTGSASTAGPGTAR